MRPVVIAGPTASGKSALALAIAERDGGRVINADALQVYSCWRVLTARPGPEALARAPHALYGHVAADARYSVGAWLHEIEAQVAASRNAGERIVIVGGSGLYLSALLEGLAFVPQIPASVRAESQAALKAGKVGVLLRHLESTDPATFARLDLQNPMRVQRAWEVLVATGRGLRDWQDERTLPLLRPDQCIRLVLSAESEFLKIAIRDRLDKMLEDGALSECADYNACGYDAALPSARALGAAPLIAHLEGRLRLEEALTAAATATSQFAKRQRTWLRNRMADWHWVDPWAGHLLTSVPRK